MERALWLLIRLRLGGWLRRLRLSLRTLKGILFTVFAVLAGGLCLSSYLLSAIFSPQRQSGLDPGDVRRYGTLGLVAYALSIIVFSSSERAITFTPAEINFLFAGPFSRRQLLGYKVVVTLFGSLIGTLVMAVVFQGYAPNFLAVFVALLLATMFLQLFAIVVALVAGMVGTLAYSRGRRVVLVLAGALVLLAAVQLGRQGAKLDWQTLASAVDDSPILSVLTWPFRVFLEAFTATQIWPDLARWAAIGFVFDLALLGLVFALDAQSLEVASSASERLYDRLQRLRSGGPAAHWGSGGRPRFSLPSLPAWGGIGPVAWRQLVTALRGLKGLLAFLVFVGAMAFWPLFMHSPEGAEKAAYGGAMTGGLLAMTLMVLPSMITFDFRGDFDRMDVLKSLPLPPMALVVGQIVTPIVIASSLQLLLLGVCQAVYGELGLVLLAGACFLLPFNFLIFGLENLLFLWFPTRNLPATAGDFQVLGRNLLIFWMKRMVQFLLIGLLVLFGVLVYFATGGQWLPALVATWALLVALDVGLVPLLALAFRGFDVARDTPA